MEEQNGSVFYSDVKDTYFERFIDNLVHFFADGVPRVPARETIEMMGLLETAYAFACEVLNEGGTFVAKIFQGGTEQNLLSEMKRRFDSVKHAKPPASRKESSEFYVVATGFKG